MRKRIIVLSIILIKFIVFSYSSNFSKVVKFDSIQVIDLNIEKPAIINFLKYTLQIKDADKLKNEILIPYFKLISLRLELNTELLKNKTLVEIREYLIKEKIYVPSYEYYLKYNNNKEFRDSISKDYNSLSEFYFSNSNNIEIYCNYLTSYILKYYYDTFFFKSSQNSVSIEESFYYKTIFIDKKEFSAVEINFHGLITTIVKYKNKYWLYALSYIWN